MAYSYDSPNFYSNSYNPSWNETDTSDFLFDSPQLETATLPQQAQPSTQQDAPSQGEEASSGHTLGPGTRIKGQSSRGTGSQLGSTTLPSNLLSASATSDHSSSSDSTMQRKRKVSISQSPPDALPNLGEDIPSAAYNDDKMFGGSALNFNGFDDGTFGPSQGLADSSLDDLFESVKTESRDMSDSPDYTGDGFGFEKNFSTSQYGSLQALDAASDQTVFARQNVGNESYQNGRSQMTVQPSRTFNLNRTEADSPMMIDSHASSPATFFNSESPSATNQDNTTLNLTGGISAPKLPNKQDSSPLNFDLGSLSDSTSTSTPPKSPSKSGSHWPCKMEVAPTPDKSRVETQIPIELTLHNVPTGITQVHLPAHTISKPKFQCKPAHEKRTDTLELSTMLVCASAMDKEGVEAQAFKRAAQDEIFVESEENQPASTKGNLEDPDPNKPLNGGPVAICSGCITRERKRAARKKTKKQDEEDEWARDEAKRVIVFNCAEVRDWCILGSKEAPVKDSEGPHEAMVVKAPMRIACYCRHQGEKAGFQVIFTLRTSKGEILAQAISQSIMITDDHKQPAGNHTQTGTMFPSANNVGMNVFPNAFGMASGAFQHQPMPFRNAMSSNDLQKLGNLAGHFASQRRPPSFSRQSSGYGSTTTTTATATPRNLSRPASPTNELGPSAKKRRGGSSHGKIPPSLAMTRMDGYSSPTSGYGGMPAAPTSAGLPSAGYGFAPHGFGPINAYGQSPDPYSSVPTTPLHGTGGLTSPTFGPTPIDNSDMYRFYSAPTSQHGSRAASRATSPASAARANREQQHQNQKQQQQHQSQSRPHSQPQSGFSHSPGAPRTATSGNGNSNGNGNGAGGNSLESPQSALSFLPPGFDFSSPPIIQRLIPNWGNVTGGEDITLLGSGFLPGLEVMFGDTASAAVTYWGPTTLVAKAPVAHDWEEGQVAVVFRHQYGGGKGLVGSGGGVGGLAAGLGALGIPRDRWRGIMPTQQVLYTYLEEEGAVMKGLSAGMRQQQLGR